MGLTREQLISDLDRLAAISPPIARTIERVGYPEPRIRPAGYETLLRTIVGQQVSVKAAASIWDKLSAAVGWIEDPLALSALSFDELRAAGLSRQKVAYSQSLASLVGDGALSLSELPEDDEEAIARLTAVKGIGRWSAEIYLLFAEGRRDIWPAGDLAVQVETGRIHDLAERPTAKQARELAEPWRPFRGAAAILMWYSYNTDVF
ncbi:DNA glycosylase [Pacificimonas flava]|uniref:DNA-3-methyladenine glycosylase II n=2 Tax=Pacificimonas TaxID=1960290 RepID=A0A219B564_9SPHN|nr:MULTISPECIES: DNA-3-methyladenine glycosylase [Pacificimonas]MBZ6379485.1 DNA-3-methyladenine glycosylase 2 family protein [Pacificimonas aurantium]OWV33324.1 DNA glycosylase [Pacificimonas flava]